MIDERPEIERALAFLLGRGTTLAAFLITLGLLRPVRGASLVPEHLVTTGVAIIIALPVLRVALMGLSFLRAGDRDLAGAAALVLAIIAVATWIGAAAG